MLLAGVSNSLIAAIHLLRMHLFSHRETIMTSLYPAECAVYNSENELYCR